MQTLLLILEAFLCPWPRPALAGCPDVHLTNEEKPSLASFFGGGKAPAQSAPVNYTPPPIPKPVPIPPPATTSGSDAAMQQQDLARQNQQRQGYSRTLLAGESNQQATTDTGRKTLLG